MAQAAHGGWSASPAHKDCVRSLGRADAALEAFELAADLTPSTLDSLAPAQSAHKSRLPLSAFTCRLQ